MRRFLDMSLDLLGICDLETRLLEVSDSWERMLGWTRDGAPRYAARSTTSTPTTCRGSRRSWRRCSRARTPRGVRVRVRCRDGSYRWVQGNARPDLAIERIYVTAADITERKASEEALVRQVALEELVATITGRLARAPTTPTCPR